MAGVPTVPQRPSERAVPSVAPPPSERLPKELAFSLKGHDGAVLAVRFNKAGTYCLSCGKARLPHSPILMLVMVTEQEAQKAQSGGCRTGRCGCGTRTKGRP